MKNRIIYLHGFASSPQSRKAQFFRQKFAEHDIALEIPELVNQGFENLTISGQLAVIERAANGEPVSVMGSSMGGYLAALYASRHPETKSVVLLAPAFEFAHRWGDRIGEDAMNDWRRTGFLDVHHYGDGKPARVNYNLIADALKYPGNPDFSQPALIFHGTLDDIVPMEVSIQYAATHPNVSLQLFEDDHELAMVFQEMWKPLPGFFSFS